MTILNQIIETKKEEIKHLTPLTLKKREPVSFKEKLTDETMNIIAEIKRASPSKGIINQGVDPVKQARAYEKSGVQAISVLTDATYFKGSLDDLKKVRQAVSLPLLCKDFIISKIQIDYAYDAGADIILLIAAALDDHRLTKLTQHAKDLNLEILYEVHTHEELMRVLKLNPQLIGINNRDLKTFTVDLNTTKKLADKITVSGISIISESGIKDQEDVETVAQAGASVILVGETLMKSPDLALTIKEFKRGIKNDKG